MNDSAKLKSLQTRLSTTRQKILELKNQSSDVNRELTRQFGIEEKLEEDIQALTEKDIQISEHAILRYLERVKGVNIEALKAEILPECVRIKAMNNRNGRLKVEDTHFVVVEEGIVTTIIINN